MTKVYKKGPQTLSEAIKEVEKLQAAQQITATLLPTSSVNTMSSDNDRCFQCQEIGHMACYCPHICCYDCYNYGHVAMDCPIRYHHLVHLHATGLTPTTGVGDPPLDITVTPDAHAMMAETDLDSAALDLAPITTAIEVVATRILAEVAPGLSTDLPITASHVTGALVPTTGAMTHLTTDLHLIGILPEMTADLDTDTDSNTTDQPEDFHPLHSAQMTMKVIQMMI